MRNNKIGLSIFLIILSIFYYEVKRKIPNFEKNIIINQEATIKKQLKYKYENYKEIGIKKIHLEAIRGKISIKKVSGINEVKIKIIKGSANSKWINIDKTINHGILYLKKGDLKNSNGEISYEIEAPKDIDYDITNRYGIIEIEGAGNINIDDKYSDININGVNSLALQTGYGNIAVKNINKDVKISTKYSKIDAYNIEGNLNIKTKYGKYIKIKKIKGRLNIATKFTPIIADSIIKKIKIKNRYCENIKIENSTDIELETSYSDITITNSKSLSLKGKENKVSATLSLLKIEGKNNKISGSADKIFINGKYDNLNLSVKDGGNIIEEKGHIKLSIDRIIKKFSFDILSTPAFIKIKNIDNTFFNVKLNWGVLNSNFLQISTDKNIIKGIYGNNGEKNIFLLNSKYSTITIIK